MQEIGEISHLANSGRLIVRLSGTVGEGQVLCDAGMARIAKVIEMIGPVRSPYASAAVLTNNTRKLAGKKVYAAEEPAVKRNKRKRRR